MYNGIFEYKITSLARIIVLVLAFKSLDVKKHSGIISLFNKNFVKTGKLSRDFGKILKKAKDLRQASDYNDFYWLVRKKPKMRDGLITNLVNSGFSYIVVEDGDFGKQIVPEAFF